MSWKFKRESTGVASGNTVSNPSAGALAGFQPFPEGNVLASKRNVIATEKGWVRRQIKNTGAGPRILDEVLVAAHPGPGGFSYASNTHLGNPDITQIYLSVSNSAAIANGATVNVYVVFNEPVKHSGAAGALRITLANTASGNNSLVATAPAVNSNTGIIVANNTLVFSFVAAPTGTYKIQAQTVANNTSTAANLRSLNVGSESANLVITGAVSNTVGSLVIV